MSGEALPPLTILTLVRRRCFPGKKSEAGSGACDDCERGKYVNTIEAAACIECVGGKFAEDLGSVTCEICDDVLVDSTTDGPGASSSAECLCARELFDPMSNEDDARCSLCPEGTTCEDRGTTLETLPVDAGKWRASNR